MGRPLFQSERNATLLVDVLRGYVMAGKFELHDFVFMPNELHLLITVTGGSTIERAMQLINDQGRILLSFEERTGVWGRSLAAWVFRAAGRRPGELSAASRIHSAKPGEGRVGECRGDISLLLHLSGKAKRKQGLNRLRKKGE